LNFTIQDALFSLKESIPTFKEATIGRI